MGITVYGWLLVMEWVRMAGMRVKRILRSGGEMAADICDRCVNYMYDEENECYCCMVNLDEDEMYHFLAGSRRECPYFRLDDEYGVVRHQI